MSLGDAYVANNGRFLRHGIPQQCCVWRHLHCLWPSTAPVEEYFVCSRLESYHRCLIVSSAADLVFVFHNASLVNDLQEPRKNSGSAASLRFSNWCWHKLTELSSLRQTCLVKIGSFTCQKLFCYCLGSCCLWTATDFMCGSKDWTAVQSKVQFLNSVWVLFIQSDNYFGEKGPLEVLLKVEPTRADSSESWAAEFWVSSRIEIPYAFWTPAPVFDHLHDKFFPASYWIVNFPFSS